MAALFESAFRSGYTKKTQNAYLDGETFHAFQEKLYEAIARNEQLVSPAVVFGELMPQFSREMNSIGERLG